MNLKQLETVTEEKSQNLAHVQALINALGNPSEWEYTGVMNDAGSMTSRCACGHTPSVMNLLLNIPKPAKRKY